MVHDGLVGEGGIVKTGKGGREVEAGAGGGTSADQPGGWSNRKGLTSARQVCRADMPQEG